jgi:predicted ribosome quality control (RQC) complex YloA/Tae2 family protein
MIVNYYTLFHVAAELNREFSGLAVNEIYTQHRSELVVSFTKTDAVIIVGCEPSNNVLYARESFARARRNSANLFAAVNGMTVSKIAMHPTDRQIQICLDDGHELVVQLFGSKANIFLLDSVGSVTDTFLKKGTALSVKLCTPVPVQPAVTSDHLRSLYNDQTLAAALKRTFPLYGAVLLQELLIRSGINGHQTVESMLETEIERVMDVSQQLTEELLSAPMPRIYFKGTSPIRLSIIPLKHLSEFQIQSFDSVSEAIQMYRTSLFHEKSTLHEKGEIVKVLQRECEHTERTLSKISAETEAPHRANQYEKFGKLLTSQLHLMNKGDTQAMVEDFVSGSNELVEVPLDEHLTPVKNAERYFEKAKKSQRAAEEQRQRVLELTKQQQIFSRLLERMEEIVTGDDLQRFVEENRKSLAHIGFKTEKSGHVKKEEMLPFRVFTVAGGFEVWAGKSGENNDLLSTRHTAKNDLWFHARGVGGSHVVLKVGTGKGEVSKRAIEQAAAIAAYYSKMKGSKLVSVTMCEGKYVRKPKGVPAGTVFVEREKTILAEPKLPDSTE